MICIYSEFLPAMLRIALQAGCLLNPEFLQN